MAQPGVQFDDSTVWQPTGISTYHAPDGLPVWNSCGRTLVINLTESCCSDKAWSVNRLGHVARLHNLPDTCVHIINTMYGFNAMEVQEAFVKVLEQANAYLLSPEEHVHGLNLINSTNLDYFQSQHQAEMLNMKAQFLQKIGEDDAG